jgi:hypothetical protein
VELLVLNCVDPDCPELELCTPAVWRRCFDRDRCLEEIDRIRPVHTKPRQNLP